MCFLTHVHITIGFLHVLLNLAWKKMCIVVDVTCMYAANKVNYLQI